jgi:4-alpha-glucanotransferase
MKNLTEQRQSGILAHITSLPSPFGIGDIGPASYVFLDFLTGADQSCWQFLPTGPTNPLFDNSPYMSTSAFAGSPLLISPELLRQDGLISQASMENHPVFSPYTTDFQAVADFKHRLLLEAFENFSTLDDPALPIFHASHSWLDDYALFMALKEHYDDIGWFDWPASIASREPEVLAEQTRLHEQRINYYRFEQFIFYRQWQLLREKAASRGIRLFGDIPIYVGLDSVDVWANQEIFTLHQITRQPTHVAGVPPDYFCETGQRWGNPLYRWNSRAAKVQEQLLDWWIKRFAAVFELVDIARIDHFRGFESYWAIPAENDTAIDGEWLKGPGEAFFHSIEKHLGNLNIIAEDLGIITPAVHKLRDSLNFPGMKVLQFAFDGDPENSFLPHNFTSPHNIVYTGTHDNDTTVGWFLGNQINDELRQRIKALANRTLHDNSGIHRDLIYLALSSISMMSILPLQDVLGFGNDCRMNSPGEPRGNWRWRCAPEFLTEEIGHYLKTQTVLFGRGRKSTVDLTLPQ